MANDPDWYPDSRPKQRAMYGNFWAKIDTHAATLGLTAAQVLALKLICEIYIAVYDWIIGFKATEGEVFPWRDELETGDEKNVQPPPIFQLLTLPIGAYNGYVTEFRDMVGLIKKLPNYTRAMGEDLMIVGEATEKPSLDTIQPSFKFEVLPGFRVRAEGKMQGMPAVKLYYRRKGQAEFAFVGFLTHLPGEIEIQPAQAGVPETGDIRAIFVQDNHEVGHFSDNTQITLS